MPVSINPTLMLALHSDDAGLFRSALEGDSGHWQWPSDSPTSDYELLMKAICLGRKRIANLLLDKGAEVYKNGSKTSPLHRAVMLVGWNSVVERLIALGARVGVQNTRGDTVLHQAFRCRAPHPVMETLLKAYVKESRMDKKNRDGLAFLHIASTREKTEYLRDFLDSYETDVNAQVSMTSGSAHAGYTALHFAVAYGRYANAEILLRNNASIYYRDVNGSTPLHFALERRNEKMIDLLLKYDVSNVDVFNDKGLSHFMAACATGDEKVVEQFINVAHTSSPNGDVRSLYRSRVKDDLSASSLGGYTALHFAAEFGKVNILHGLIAIGADPLARTSFKMTPFMLAAKQEQTNVCLFMQHHYEYACDEASVDHAASFDTIAQQIVDSLSNAAADDDLANNNKVLVDDSKPLAVVASRCAEEKPVAKAPTTLELVYELLKV